MTDAKVHHATFTIERAYAFAPALVFNAFEDNAAKRRWFVEGDDDNWQIESFEMDFQIGGFERSRFRYAGGPLISAARSSATTRFISISFPNERLIIAYTMAAEGHIFSSSMSTIEFKPHGSGTRLIYTEQGAYVGSPDQVADREHGCGGLFDSLGKELERVDP